MTDDAKDSIISAQRQQIERLQAELDSCQQGRIEDTARLRQALTTAQREVEALRLRVIWLEDSAK